MSIENGLQDVYNLIKQSHMCRCIEANNADLPFDGMTLAKLVLVHKKVSSGGKEVFITEVYPSVELRRQLMGPIERMASKRVEVAQKVGSAGNISLLQGEAQKLMQNAVERIEAPEQYSVEDQDSLTDGLTTEDEIATYEEFSGSDVVVEDDTTDKADANDAATRTLLDSE
jgi:hypothetical protein